MDNSDILLKTTVIDAKNNKQETFANGSGLTVKSLQHKHIDPDTVLTTLFEYDVVNQLKKVTDDAGKSTESLYDWAGNRTQVKHPASGTTTFGYDPAGNTLWKYTANKDSILYGYEYNRLRTISYPRHPENNVVYTYGLAQNTDNRAGRLVGIEDGSGAQEFKYGRQGEVTEVRRTLVIPNQGVASYVTKTEYDSWNRLLKMIYPDGEVVNYSYNTGGLLAGVSSGTTTYVKNILYDKFEQRTQLQYGNGNGGFGAVTTYSYQPTNRLLDQLSVASKGTTIMQNAYLYDEVGNITQIENTGTSVTANKTISGTIGGTMKHTYQYDNLYRLKEAHGVYNDGVTSKNARYDLYMDYDNMHNIVSKKQQISQTGVQFAGSLNAGYELNYTINANNSQQIANIADESYRYEGTKLVTPPAAAVVKKSQVYSYDANGNMIYVASGKLLSDSTLQATNTRKLLWDEENRLLGISDNGYVSNYWYDAAGERTVKQSGGNEGVFVNGVLSGARTETGKFTAYVSPYLVVSNGGNYTKHIYMGSQRITSKVSNSGIFTSRNPLTDTTALNKSYTAKLASLTEKIKERFDSLGVVYNGIAQTGGLISSNPDTTASSYFYHSDHLGSSSLITDGTGALVQHIEYVPFGETFIDERNGNWSTPFLFNGKEKDEETGLHYYGARYYDSRLGVWLSVDPLAEKYPNVGSYVYCVNNPVKYVDPDGRKILNYDSDGNYMGTSKNNWWHNFWHGSIGSINGTDGTSRKFKFASKDDAQNIINLESKGIKTRLFEISKSQIIEYVNEAGAFSENNKNNKLDFIASQAVAGGSFDFSVGPLLDNYLKYGASGDALEISKVYFLPEGDVVAHNQFNFGNFLYGYGGHNLGLSIEILRIGAHVNSLVNSVNNNYTSQLDSHDDQFSIIRGYQYHNIGPKVGFITIEFGCPTYRQGAFHELIKKTSNLLFKRLKQ